MVEQSADSSLGAEEQGYQNAVVVLVVLLTYDLTLALDHGAQPVLDFVAEFCTNLHHRPLHCFLQEQQCSSEQS